MATRQFEPLSVGGILDRTFTIYRENFVRFLAIVAVVYVPIALITGVSTWLLAGGAAVNEMELAGPRGGAGLMIAGLFGLIIAIFLGIIGKVLASGALLRSVSEYYLGNDVSVGEAYGLVLPKLGTLIWAGFLVGVICMLGMILLIVPGIIFGLWFSLVTPVIVLENLRATEGMSRSKALVSGNLGKIFGTLLLTGIISAIIGALIGGIGGFIGGAVLGKAAGTLVGQFAQAAGEIVAAPIWAVAIVLLYYDLRIRKEGFDLEMMARQMNRSPGVPPLPTAGPRV